MEIASFEEADALDRDALQALLDGGRPEQRIWAIWALALRTDGAELSRRVVREPSPSPDSGVRRTLAVILAAHGETDLLIALARHDPELVVRESAIQLVTRLASGGRIDPGVVVEQASDPAMLLAILGALGSDAPPAFVRLAADGLRASSRPVKLEAFEALLRIARPETTIMARRWMFEQKDIGEACDRWLRAASVESLAEAFADRRPQVRGQVLARLVRPPWPVVERLVGIDPQLLDAAFSRTDIAIPIRIVARAVLAGAGFGFVQRLAGQLAAAGDGRALLADIRAAMNDREPALRALAKRAQAYADALEISGSTALLDELAGHHPVEHLLGLENTVARWLAEVDAPPDLLPLVPELRDHCAQAISELARRDGRRPARDLPALPAPGATRAAQADWQTERHLRDLAAALAKL